MWKHGELNGFKWCIKVYGDGSEFGIDNGRISKLWIQRGKIKKKSLTMIEAGT